VLRVPRRSVRFRPAERNVSRIFQTLGAEVDEIAGLWVAAPLTGLIVQPIIGYMSDRTWNFLRRRRRISSQAPYLTSLALLFMPHSTTLWMAAGVWLLDASINIAMGLSVPSFATVAAAARASG
jgi:maltose/moltooligosaccharide transporter